MNELLGKTPLSDNHNTRGDRSFLTNVFKKYTELGQDGQESLNGKRVLTLWNSKWAAREILNGWKGMHGQELDDFIDSSNFENIFKEFDYNKSGTIDQRDAYFWAYKLVGEDYEGVISSEGM